MDESIKALKEAMKAEGIVPKAAGRTASLLGKKPPAAVLEELEGLTDGLRDFRDLLEKERNEVSGMKVQLETDRETLKRQRASHAQKINSQQQEKKQLDALREQLDSDRAALASERRKLDKRQRDLIESEEVLSKRETDAEAGFLQRRQESLGALEQTHQRLLQECETLARQLEEKRQAHVAKLLKQEEDHHDHLSKLDEDLQERHRGLRERLEKEARERTLALFSEKDQLADERRDLLVKEQQVARVQEDLDALQEDLNSVIADRTDQKVNSLKQQLTDASAAREPLRRRIQELEQALESRGAAEAALGHEPPEVIRRRLTDYEAERQRLRDELSNRPAATEVEELQRLRKAREDWEQERRNLQEEAHRMTRRLSALEIANDQAESLRDRNQAMQENQRLLSAALDQLREDVDDRLRSGRDQTSFPELLRMDEDPALKQPTARFFTPTSRSMALEKFASDLRYQLGSPSKEGQPELYYSARDVRAFLGGLAMSRLHLLQGISGIGKSSLPRRFAQAVGGACFTVTVQAGWTDKADLFGYYNAFEGRYYETAFVKALYQAQSKAFQDRIVLVLLDEMNLSHPEQYGADILDVLARDSRDERVFELMAHQTSGQAPSGLLEGRLLPLPENVWFIGTANHDETTKDFAEKTYDRSFVLELPGQPEPFELKKVRPRSPINFDMLRQAFSEARDTHADEAEQARAWLNGPLRSIMAERFDVGWGGRLLKQVGRFVPVVVASGGSWCEALDQLVAHRILRRIRGRHDLLLEDVQELQRTLEQGWPQDGDRADQSLTILERESQRLGGS